MSPFRPVADPPPSQEDVAPSLAQEAADAVLRARPDFAAACTLFEQDSAPRRAFNT
jgi:hypothetical protein